MAHGQGGQSALRRKPAEPEIPPAVDEAIAWMVRLSSQDASDTDRADFERWLRRSPAHQGAWVDLASSLDPVHIAGDQQRRPGALAERALRNSVSRRTVVRSLIGIGVVAPIAASAVNRFVPLLDLMADCITLTGERRNVDLADGSSLVLGPRTAVDISFNGVAREVTLRSGEMMLRGLERNIPLVVKARDFSLQAISGTFVVRQRDNFLTMAAIDAPANIQHRQAAPFALAQGEAIAFDGARVSRRKAEIKTETTWVDGLLSVEDHSLSYVVARLRPYFAGAISVASNVAQTRVTGVFPLANVAEAIELMAGGLDLTIRRTTPYWISIEKGASAPA